MSASQKATRLPSARDRLLKNKQQIRDLYGLSRQRITQRTIQPPAGGSGSPRGVTAPAGNFLATEGDTMVGPIAFFPRLTFIVDNVGQDDDDSINIADVNTATTNPPEAYSSYVLVTPIGSDDNLRTIFGAGFSGQLLYLQGTATTTIRLQHGTTTNDGNILTPDGSEFAIDGAKIVTLIFDITVSLGPNVSGSWRIITNRGSALRDIIHAKLGADESGLIAGDRVGFDTVIDGVQTGLAINATAGIFENFQAGRTYILESAVEANFSVNTGEAQYQWFDILNGVFIGNEGGVIAITGSGSAQRIDEQQQAIAIVSPSVAGQTYELRIIAEVNLLDIQQEQSYVFIQEQGGAGFGGGGGGGGGINFPILYPIDAFGTAPVSPTTTDIDLSATTAHVHTLDTVGDVTINFQNPPVGLFNITGELIITTDGSGSIVTFSQTTNPSSSFTIAPNTRTIITFQSSDNGATYDVFEAGQAGGGGGATALNDLTDVNLSSVSLNDVFQFNGVFWINKQSFNFGTSPFSSTGFLRFSNDEIMLGARNAANTGDLELKNTNLGTLDWTDSGDNVAAIQARTQHPVDPDNRISISVGSGIGADALLDTSVTSLRFGVGGDLPFQLDSAGQLALLTDYFFSILDTGSGKTFSITNLGGTAGTTMQAVDNLNIAFGGTTRAVFDDAAGQLRLQNATSLSIFDIPTGKDFSIANLGGVFGTEYRAVDSHKYFLSGTEVVRYDDAASSVILSDFFLNIFDTFTGKGFSLTNLGGTAGSEIRVVDRLRLTFSGVEIVDIEEAGSNFVINDYLFHIFDTGSGQDFSIGNFGTGLGSTIQAIEFLKFSLGGGTNHMQLRNTGGTTDLRLQNPSSNSDPVIFRMLANNAVDPRNDMFFSMQSGIAGKFLIFTETPEMQIIVDGAVTGAITPNLTLSRLGSINALSINQNSLNNLDFNFINIPSTMTAGRIGATNYVAKNTSSTIQNYARTQGRAENVTAGNEDGRYDIDVAINGVLTQLATFGNDTNIFSIDDITISAGDSLSLFASGSFLNIGAGGGGAELQVQAGVLVLNSGTNLIMSGVGANGFIEQQEITDPSAPVANIARIYTRDNGGGKTQVVVRFATGAIQVIATEP